jgi:hypothetical protein
LRLTSTLPAAPSAALPATASAPLTSVPRPLPPPPESRDAGDVSPERCARDAVRPLAPDAEEAERLAAVARLDVVARFDPAARPEEAGRLAGRLAAAVRVAAAERLPEARLAVLARWDRVAAAGREPDPDLDCRRAGAPEDCVGCALEFEGLPSADFCVEREVLFRASL